MTEKIYCIFNNTKEEINERLKRAFKEYIKNDENKTINNKKIQENFEENSKMH